MNDSMWNILNKKVSTPIGFIVLFSVTFLVGWLILNQYKKVVETRFEMIELNSSTERRIQEEK